MMRSKAAVVLFLFFLTATATSAQVSTGDQAVAQDVAKIAASVQSLSKSLRDFVDKMGKAETNATLADRYQKLILGMQLLVQAEQRMATHQRYNVEVAEKEISVRARLAQVDIELGNLDRTYPSNIEGSTRTPEIRETRRAALQAERQTLTNGLQQIQAALADAQASVRESRELVLRLRRTFLPQLDRELAEQ
jgi:hypothetical protein